MAYKASATKNFLREFMKLPKDARERIAKAVDGLIANPVSGTKLQGELAGLWRARVGDYRIIYSIEQKEEAIVLLDVGMRKNVYQ